MAKGLHGHTVQESVNASLGQGGCQFVNTSGTITPVAGDFIAITFIEDTILDLLTPVDGAIYAGNTAGAGDDIPSTLTFPAGLTIFGRWSAFSISGSSSVLAYIG